MKKVLCGILVVVLLFLSFSLCAISQYSKIRIKDLDSCYEPIVAAVREGFNKETASEHKDIFKKVLENGITEKCYIKSKFFDSDITFAEWGWNCPKERVDLNTYHCRDLILAMYLACVLTTEPENLSLELEWLKDGVWQMDAKHEFMHLMSEAYNPNKNDISIIVNSIKDFAKQVEHPYDKWQTMGFVYTFINDYNDIHPDDKYVMSDEIAYLNEMKEIQSQINDEDFSSIWVGYGKVIRK